MTRRHRLIRRLTPYRELLEDANARNAKLRATVAAQDATIKALRVELAVEHARWRLAQTQRDRARDLAGALMGEVREFSAGDLAWLDEHGVGAE